jgi:multimeric flavodoxin WrbA
MRVVALLGSPRKDGVGAQLVSRFCDAAKRRGADITVHALNELVYRGCQGCMKCKTGSAVCVTEDGLTRVLADVAAADVLVVASPVYFGEISGQLKCFVDRTFSYLVPDFFTNPQRSRLKPGKALVFVMTQGDENEKEYAAVASRYVQTFGAFGFSASEAILACGDPLGQPETRDALYCRVDETVEKTIG